MKKYIKHLIILIFISTLLEASSHDLRLIQGEFYNKIVLEPLYNKYYVKSLEKACKNKAKECYGIRLSNFMQKKYVKMQSKKEIKDLN